MAGETPKEDNVPHPRLMHGVIHRNVLQVPVGRAACIEMFGLRF